MCRWKPVLALMITLGFLPGGTLLSAQEEIQRRPVPPRGSYEFYSDDVGPAARQIPAPGAGAGAGVVHAEIVPPGAPATPATPSQPTDNHYAPGAGSDKCRQCMRSPRMVRMGRFEEAWHCRMKPWLRATHWGYPEYFIPEPYGVLVHEHFNTQVGNAQAAQLILYRCDFAARDGASAKLSVYGQMRLKKMLHLLSTTPLPLMIEGELDNARLNTARKHQVLEEVARLSPAPLDPERVIIVDPTGPGLDGFEAFDVYKSYLRNSATGGRLTRSPGAASNGSGSNQNGAGGSPNR
jgi:hypothetical protein